MLSPSPLRPSAPSVSLLRFLRSQSDVLHSFPRTTCARSGLPYQSSSRRKISSRVSHYSKPRQGTSETSVISSRGPPRRVSSRCRTALNATARPRALPPSLQSALSRNASTSSRPFLRRLLDLKGGKPAESNVNLGNGPSLLDEKMEPNFSITAKASNELRLRCTEFDGNGNVTLINGEFKKSELIAKVR